MLEFAVILAAIYLSNVVTRWYLLKDRFMIIETDEWEKMLKIREEYNDLRLKLLDSEGVFAGNKGECK
jgi:hypothetical protein